MATTRKRSPVSTTVPKDTLEQATSALQELPQKPKDIWSLREAIELLQDSITAALDKGYSHDEVAAMLTDRGVEINASSLKYYLSAAKRRKNATTQPKAKQARKIKEKKLMLQSKQKHSLMLLLCQKITNQNQPERKESQA